MELTLLMSAERAKARDRFKLSTAVFLFLLKDEELLFLLRADTGWMDGQYTVPSGVKEPGETLAQATAREATEEIDVAILAEDLILVHLMHNFTTGQEWIGAFFATEKWEGEPKLNEPHKHGELKWADPHRLPDNTSPYVRQAIEHYLANIAYSEFGWDVAEDGEEEHYIAQNGKPNGNSEGQK